MKFYAHPRHDGGVTVHQVRDGVTIEECLAKKPPAELARYSGDPVEITEAEYRAHGAANGKYREAWTLVGKKLAVNAAKKAEIDARPPVKTLAERVADLEKAR